MENAMNAVAALLKQQAAEYEAPSIEWEREARAAFDDACMPESRWDAWAEAWIDAVYLESGARLSRADFKVSP